MDIRAKGQAIRWAPAVLLAAWAAASGAALAAEPVRLASHLAIYDLVLDPAKRDDSIGGARGRIVFEFSGNACEGYVQNFRQVTQIANIDSGERTFDSRNNTWEDGEARSFRFDSERRMDNSVTESARGRAEQVPGSGVAVTVDRPERKEAALGEGVLFPTQQIRAILDAARADRRVFESRIFDGGDGGTTIYQTTAVIGAPIMDGGAGLDEDLKGKGFEGMRRWPVTVSYFEPGQGEQRPVSVVSYDVLENGITNRLRIDFGDFAMNGEPTRVDLLPESACER